MILINFKPKSKKLTFDDRFPWRNRNIRIDGDVFLLTEGFLILRGEFIYKIPTKQGYSIVGDLIFLVTKQGIYVERGDVFYQ